MAIVPQTSIYVFFVFVFNYGVCEFVTMYVGVCRGQKRLLDPLLLELHRVIIYLIWMLGNTLGLFTRASGFNQDESYLLPPYLAFLRHGLSLAGNALDRLNGQQAQGSYILLPSAGATCPCHILSFPRD